MILIITWDLQVFWNPKLSGWKRFARAHRGRDEWRNGRAVYDFAPETPQFSKRRGFWDQSESFTG